MPKPGPLAAIEADPEFATFPPEVQARILKDAKRAAPTRPTPQPAPAPTPAKPSHPPLMTLAAMDPRPAGPSIAELANEKRRRLIPADLPQRASLIDEARAVMPEFPGERQADVAARNRRLATPPIPGTKESAARATREVVTENLLGGVSGGMMLAPNYQQNMQRALPPMRQPIPARPPLVTPQAADPTTRERLGAMAKEGGAMLRGVYDAIEGPIEDVARDPSRLHPLSPGFLEGAVATPLGTAALAVDPAGGYGFGLAGLGAKTLGKGAMTAARGANLAAGDFAGRLGQAVTPGIEAAIPRIGAAADFLGSQMKARPGAIFPERSQQPATIGSMSELYDYGAAARAKLDLQAMGGNASTQRISPEQQARIYAAALERTGFDKLLADAPSVRFADSIDQWSGAGGAGVSAANRIYLQALDAEQFAKNQIHTRGSAERHGIREFIDADAATPDEAMERTLAHELGHQIRNALADLARSGDEKARRLNEQMDKAHDGASAAMRRFYDSDDIDGQHGPESTELGLVSSYAGEDPEEFFAESWLSHHYEPDYLQKVNPTVAGLIGEVKAHLAQTRGRSQEAPLLPTAGIIAQAAEVQRAAPRFRPDDQLPEGARRGSLRVGRPASDAWTPAQQAANRAIERKIRELVKERKAAEDMGNAGRVTELDAEIQGLDDARVVIPKPGQGPVTTIADLQAQQAAAATAGDTATVNRLDRQIRRMRASNYHNETKYAFLGPESVDKFTGLLEQQVAELRAAGRDPRQPVPFSVVRRQAQEILPFALEQIGRKGLKKGESLTAAEYEAAKNYMQQLVEESVAVDRRVHAIRAAQNNGPVAIGADGLPIAPENLSQALTIESARAMQLDKDASGLMEIVTQSRSQKGRDLNYLKMVAQQSWDPAYWLARADRTSGGTATSAQIGAIGRIVIEGQQAEAAGNAAAQRQARIDLAQAMGRLTVTPWLDALLMARKAGLLSGVKTIARNTSSNTLNLGLEEMVNVIGVVPDAFLSMATGRRTVFAREAANIGRAVNESLTRGVAEARETMLYGMPLDQLAALDIPSEVNSPSRALNTYVNTIMRFQGAQDRLFKAYALRRSLDGQARSLALEASNAPGPRASRAVVDAHARYLADNPTEAMMMEALADAEFATFQNDTAISDAISAFKRGLRTYDTKTNSNTGKGLGAAMDLFLPFVKTPASIGARVLDYTVGTGTYQASRRRGRRLAQERAQANNPNRSQAQRANTPPIEWMTREEQRAISKGLSRQAIGATLIWYGQHLFEQGRLTGTDQLDRREENAAAGRIGNAIKVGDEWVPLNPFSPVGNLLTLGATMARDGAPDGQDAAIRTATQVLALMLDQPFTQGMKQAVEVAGDTGGRKMNRFAGGVAGSVVPSLVNEAAMFLDQSDEARAIDYSNPTAAALQSIQARLPGLRQGLPVRYTGLGDAQDANTGWRALAAGAGRFARENYDPMAREILTTGASLPRLQDDVQLQRGEAPVPLTLPEQQELLRMRGASARQGIMAGMSDPAYTSQMPDVQRDLLDRIIKGRSAAALNQFLTPEMRALLAERQAQASDAERSRRGRGRAVVGPLVQP
jgi:hypothetical protein